jgi:hypothetical protein
MFRLVVLLVSIYVLLSGLLPTGNMAEVAQATAVWNQHREASHPKMTFLDFFIDHYLEHTHDDPSGAHQKLPLSTHQDITWACLTLEPYTYVYFPFTEDTSLELLYSSVPVHAARKGIGLPDLRPPRS